MNQSLAVGRYTTDGGALPELVVLEGNRIVHHDGNEGYAFGVDEQRHGTFEVAESSKDDGGCLHGGCLRLIIRFTREKGNYGREVGDERTDDAIDETVEAEVTADGKAILFKEKKFEYVSAETQIVDVCTRR
uniref:Uncharacterized protein n=1 Tax=Chromera velia CCMP2878 TaxID=1169474 RepID=A0A0G4FGA9_9ALVE|mmetsp:Transcript_9777/g.18957  ORF Transcript_9777/g.18957 Transcript_9777/m.18957 type:complete len:132 (-) Transcript_9777:228-623(-)|eukprot:Cvel_3310.t1-p1 / transcript=Cvel_3310.t1 / gene=Cvel_3310 / organism=Chromera_velia_CCMP2878 / gene_product=hypothetical protein / transcript_product=hypothetical protein / location=Cvel_scaffold131:70290-70682(-) / protein_length=131 / sequence_SO=supercontig / SO=protein_coding / is_pseudo=false